MGIGKNAAMRHTNEVGCGKRDDEVKGEVAGGLTEGGSRTCGDILGGFL